MTREEIMGLWAAKAMQQSKETIGIEMLIVDFANAIEASVKERAARVCEQRDGDGEGPDCWDWHAKDYAAAIRAMP